MFFWNKYCGLALMFLNFNTTLSAQNAGFQLIESSFILKNISPAHENNGRIYFGDSWLSGKKDYTVLSNSSVVIPAVSPAIHTQISDYIASPMNKEAGKLIPVKSLQSDSETQLTKIIPSDFSTCRYGFFCKQEVKIEKATKLPLRLRIGSLQQCNYYEGKP